MCGRIGAVGARGEHGDRRRVGAERTAVGGVVDAERRAGDHRPSRQPDLGCDVGGDLLAVGARRAGADERDRRRPASPGGAAPCTHSPIGTPARSWSGSTPCRSSSWRGHSSSPGITKRTPQPRACSSVASTSTPASRAAAAVSSSCRSGSVRRAASSSRPPELVGERRRTPVPRLADQAQGQPRAPFDARAASLIRPAPCRAMPQVERMRRRGGGARVSTSSTPGTTSRPERTEARSAMLHASRATRTAPRALSRPR